MAHFGGPRAATELKSGCCAGREIFARTITLSLRGLALAKNVPFLCVVQPRVRLSVVVVSVWVGNRMRRLKHTVGSLHEWFGQNLDIMFTSQCNQLSGALVLAGRWSWS